MPLSPTLEMHALVHAPLAHPHTPAPAPAPCTPPFPLTYMPMHPLATRLASVARTSREHPVSASQIVEEAKKKGLSAKMINEDTVKDNPSLFGRIR
ncbi:hypothetical protein OF83DRAFT_1180497 [Amylostereum chailletii]|nr:hypothetical protein OF83DRAFT_1180497 [Amylostereum chailletii]